MYRLDLILHFDMFYIRGLGGGSLFHLVAFMVYLFTVNLYIAAMNKQRFAFSGITFSRPMSGLRE